jgi:hypothetical protein
MIGHTPKVKMGKIRNSKFLPAGRQAKQTGKMQKKRNNFWSLAEIFIILNFSWFVLNFDI